MPGTTIDELVRKLPGLIGAEISRLEAEIRRERERRGEPVSGAVDKKPPAQAEVLAYRPYSDGHLQLELRRYFRKDGSARERGPYWYFRYHEGGKQKRLYLGKTNDPEGELERRRANS